MESNTDSKEGVKNSSNGEDVPCKDRADTSMLRPNRKQYLVIYCVVFAIIFSIGLLFIVARSPYLCPESFLKNCIKNEGGIEFDIILVTMLFTMLIAGAAGGALCNLRGLFKYISDCDGRFPSELETPYYIRPITGAVTGLFTFFVGTLIASSFTIDVSFQTWATLEGRIPFIALALLAGFAAQEFMEKLKEVAKTTFSSIDSDQKNEHKGENNSSE